MSALARALLLASTIFSLSACAPLEFERGVQDTGFELAGRIAVRYGDEASSGNLRWRHDAEGDEMLISNALGQGMARIVREGAQVTLTTADGREHRASDAEALTERLLGYRLPLAGLADWVRARPAAAGAAHAQRDAQGRLAVLEQAGWRIEYLAYGAPDDLPRRLRMTYPNVELRLVIGDWRVAQALR